jgi:hypothetical protein
VYHHHQHHHQIDPILDIAKFNPGEVADEAAVH